MIAKCKNCDTYQSVNSTYITYYNSRWVCKHCRVINIIHNKKRKDR